MAPIYKRVQYQKLNGFDVPYWDIEVLSEVSPSLTPSITPTPSISCGIPSGYDCINVSNLSSPNNWANGDYTFLSFGFHNNSNQLLECGCEYEYSIYQHNTKPWITLSRYYDISLGSYIYGFRHNGFLGNPQPVSCGNSYSASSLVMNPENGVPTQFVGGRYYPSATTFIDGVISYITCPTPTATPTITPTITPSNTNTPTISITPSITSTPPPSKSATPTATPTITNTPSITPTNTPSSSPKASATPTATPTPSPTDPCYCKYYSIDNNDKGNTLSVEYVDCDTLNTEILIVPTDTITTQCSCSTPIRVFGSTDYTITLLGACPT